MVSLIAITIHRDKLILCVLEYVVTLTVTVYMFATSILWCLALDYTRHTPMHARGSLCVLGKIS